MADDRWPAAEATISVRPECCARELTSRVVAVDDDGFAIVAPEHGCVPVLPPADTASLLAWPAIVGRLELSARILGSSDPDVWRLAGDGQPVAVQRRGFVRVPTDIPVQIETRLGPVPATVLDVSEGGLRASVPADAQLCVGEKV